MASLMGAGRWARLRQLDWWMIGAVALLICFSLVALYSGTLSDPGNWSLVRKQLAVAAVGLVGALALASLDYRAFNIYGKAIFLVVLLLLLAVLVTGRAVRGSTAWLNVFGAGLQPVEFAKLGVLLLLSRYFSRNIGESGRWRPLIGSGVLLVACVGLVLLQPDFGSAVIIMAVWAGLVFFFGLRWRQWAVLLATGAAALVAAGLLLFDPYQVQRLVTFIDPAHDPLGSGYNVRQSIVAIGSGQWLGRGIGLGSQSQLNFLPEQYTDFIFSSLAEELGFIGAAGIVALLAVVVVRLVAAARRSEDDFGSFVCLGLAVWVAVQAFINLGGVLGLVPLTGVPLPFVSAGGSSLLALLLAIGIAESVYIRGRRPLGD